MDKKDIKTKKEQASTLEQYAIVLLNEKDNENSLLLKDIECYKTTISNKDKVISELESDMNKLKQILKIFTPILSSSSSYTYGSGEKRYIKMDNYFWEDSSNKELFEFLVKLLNLNIEKTDSDSTFKGI